MMLVQLCMQRTQLTVKLYKAWNYQSHTHAHIHLCTPSESCVLTSQAVHLCPNWPQGCFVPSGSLAGQYWQSIVFRQPHTHTHTNLRQPDNSCPHRDPGNRHRHASISVSFWPLNAIMATVPQRGRWELSAYENQIVKLHSQTWLISEAVAFLQAKRNKESGQQRDKVCSPLTLCPPLTQCLSYGHSPGKETISGCLYTITRLQINPATRSDSSAASHFKKERL